MGLKESSDDEDMPLTSLTKNKKNGRRSSNPRQTRTRKQINYNDDESDEDDEAEFDFDQEEAATAAKDDTEDDSAEEGEIMEEEDDDDYNEDGNDEEEEEEEEGEIDEDSDEDSDEDEPLSSLKSSPSRKRKSSTNAKSKSTTTKKAKTASTKKSTSKDKAKTKAKAKTKTKTKTSTKSKTKAKTTTKKKSTATTALSSDTSSPSAALYNSSQKGKLISEVLKRWWYGITWPEPSCVPKSIPTNCDKLDGFPGLYVMTSGDDVGKIIDYRNHDECPNFKNMCRKSSEELKELLLNCIDEQRRVLVENEGEGTQTEKDLNKLEKWTKKVDVNKADREAGKVLKAAGFQIK